LSVVSMNRGKRGNVPECGDIVLTTSRGIVAVTARTANCRIAVRPSLLLLSKRPLRSSSIAKGRFFQGELTKLNWLKARRREHSHTGNYLHAHDCNVTPMAASILGSDGPTSFGAGARPCATAARPLWVLSAQRTFAAGRERRGRGPPPLRRVVSPGLLKWDGGGQASAIHTSVPIRLSPQRAQGASRLDN